MSAIKAIYKNAWPYLEDAMQLPVASVQQSVPYYQSIFGFKLESVTEEPVPIAILTRDDIRIGLAENGGDSSQEGCFFEVDNVQSAFNELKINGLQKEISSFEEHKHGETVWKVFFVVAPDGLCYCIGESVL